VIPLDGAGDPAEAVSEGWMEDDPDQDPERLAMRAQMRRQMEARIGRLREAYRSMPTGAVAQW